MTTPEQAQFDFDAWATLAAADPGEFERVSRAAVEGLIASAPVALQPRLRRLQWRIDMERRRCKTPLAACIRISGMMWDKVYGRDGLLDALHAAAHVEPASAQGEDRDATVLPFPTRH